MVARELSARTQRRNKTLVRDDFDLRRSPSRSVPDARHNGYGNALVPFSHWHGYQGKHGSAAPCRNHYLAGHVIDRIVETGGCSTTELVVNNGRLSWVYL